MQKERENGKDINSIQGKFQDKIKLRKDTGY